MTSKKERRAGSLALKRSALAQTINELSKSLKLACRQLDDAAGVFTRASRSRGDPPVELAAVEYPTADEVRTQLRKLRAAREEYRGIMEELNRL